MKVRAIKNCYYNSNKQIGEVFEMSNQFARAFIALGKVELFTEQTIEPKVKTPIKTKKQTYQTKDLKAKQ